MDGDPFHRGEHDAQRRAGVQRFSAPIRAEIPDQHRSFFAGLPMVFVGVANGSGWPVATVLAGAPGFISSPDPRTLHIGALPGPDDPAARWLHAGAPAGLLGIDLSTRRRNRVNGTVLATDEQGFTLGVSQSFGNCPQYIQAREVQPQGTDRVAAAERLGGLDPQACALIAAADTFFVASSSGADGAEPGGMDISHRGGRPGFVRVDGDVLTIPDFRGNRYFNTLGNLLLEPRAGLLFVDFQDGGLLTCKVGLRSTGLPPRRAASWAPSESGACMSRPAGDVPAPWPSDGRSGTTRQLPSGLANGPRRNRRAEQRSAFRHLISTKLARLRR